MKVVTCDICTKATAKVTRRNPPDWLVLYELTYYPSGGSRYIAIPVCPECKHEYRIEAIEHIIRRRAKEKAPSG